MAKIKSTKEELVFEGILVLLLSLVTLVVLYPLILVVSESFSDPLAVLANEVKLFPVRPTLKMYEVVFSNSEIWSGYLNTIIYTLVGTTISIVLTALGAYPLSRKDMYGRNIFTALFVFTMFFSGGMIPSYLLVKNLDIYNSIWAIVLPAAVSTYNMIIMRTFFENTIPTELQESAFIDGANDITVFIKIILPLSAPIMAVMVLFYGVASWNSWFSALLYLSDRAKYPLQIILREILLQSSDQGASAGASDQELIGEGVKYATMVVATLPILCLYPFLQKYFVKGVMIGAVKG